MVHIAALLLSATHSITPIDFGREEISRAAGPRAANVEVEITPGGAKESFRIDGDGQKVRITAPDQTGAMYGEYEFAERLKNKVESAWSTKMQDKPFLPDRGLNLFLTLPWDYKKNDTDYDVAALTDPNRWWFANEDYWTTLLDLMAKSRLNWLDIHGGWDVSVTNAPNMYAYFVTSPSFPLVGVPQATKDADLKQLNHVIDMAHQRGIRVSLMCYEANLKIPQNPNPPYQATEQNIYKYTKEVVEQMIRRAPGLDAIGYRIGESGHGENFFTCYGEAIKASGRDIPIVTRSWITRKQKVLPLARASKDFTVEIKYNGEQWGAPYQVAGGRMARWGSYSFEDYLSDSTPPGGGSAASKDGDADTQTAGPSVRSFDSGPAGRSSAQDDKFSRAAKLWPGWPAEGGGTWPSEPYKIVWQVRANGTHRIFPFYNPNWVRRSIAEMKMGTVSGYTIEGEDAYYPKSPDYYLANPADKYCDWIHQRDEMYWMTWGRLGYDPNTPDEVFDARAKDLLGPGSDDLVKAWKEASVLVSKSYMAYSIGPDHRDHAIELEWGGDQGAFMQGQPFDTLTFMPIQEEQANFATAGVDGRVDMWHAAGNLVVDASQLEVNRLASFTKKYVESSNSRVREIANAVLMDETLSGYYGYRHWSADLAAMIEADPGAIDRGVGLVARPKALQFGWSTAHKMLADNVFYRPFTERLRMHTNTFRWADEQKKADAEVARIPAAAEVRIPWRGLNSSSSKAWSESKGQLTWRADRGDLIARLDSEFQPERAWILVKPLPSSTLFHKVPMVMVGKGFEVRFKRSRWGYAIAAEGYAAGAARRFPDVQSERPYLVIPSQPGPTPQIYSSEESMSFLDPKALTTDKFGGMLIGTRAQNFFHRFAKATQRKLLDPVKRGMRLVILQEDFNKDKLDFLPKPLKFEGFQSNTFDPGGQLGLQKVDVDGIMYQRFLPSDGWEVFGNGGLARLKLGRGEVWVTSARLMQAMHMPSAAKAFVQMLSLGGKEKPTVVIDACTEGGPFTSSCHEDLMNSHDIPFLTLGEAIAQEQGMNSFTVIPGPTMNDDVLDGKGAAMATKFLRDQVIALSKRPTPPNLAAFEKLRVQRKKELMKSLGLDPMPPRTPLNARITGTIQRDGYHIEKLVFESRPNFFVTGHVYIANGSHGKLPVIVNVNGHWAHKKDEDRIQLRAAFQALQGYIAIAIDSPGVSFEGNSLIERRAEGTHDDFELVEGGTNTTGYYVWDAMRALDYMATRTDTDMDHIGITGASGGGLATLYTFAADDRYKAAVPVVYLASMELAPDNGCLCNHVPATCQIGDRSDVMAIQAPKPVYMMGAQNDGEFPPAATRLTHKKMQESWKLFGKDGDVYVQIFAGGHDYNQLMREASIGFFNRYLKGQGDGSPVKQPPLQAIDPQDRQLLALDPPATDERTMRDLSKEYLANAPQNVPAENAIAVNGGRPAKSLLNYKETASGSQKIVTFESEPGLTTPGILVLPNGTIKGVRIYMSDAGKAAEIARGSSDDGYAHFYIDGLGTGELAGIEMRYPVYAGRAVSFTAGWQLVRAAEAMRKYSSHIEIQGRGPISSQAAMWAGLLSPGFDKVTGLDCLGSWADVFRDGVTVMAVQPRAHLCGSLDNLRKQVKNGTWVFAVP
ncbi:MAG: alpha/beta hydrolase family protein [Fimbriimonadales bacterium]